jgi:hypothetical protein
VPTCSSVWLLRLRGNNKKLQKKIAVPSIEEFRKLWRSKMDRVVARMIETPSLERMQVGMPIVNE